MKEASWQKVSKSPLNSSKTKMLYSFSKSRRFEERESRSSSHNSCDKFYYLPPLLGRNAPKASIGFGKKTEVIQSHMLSSPSPSKYSIKSIFDECKKGYGFRLGRDKLKQSSIFTYSRTPGPGAYYAKRKSTGPYVTLKPRLKEIHDSSYATPGPGSYNVPKFLSYTGKYTLSTLRNISGPRLKEEKSRSTSKSRIDPPGPGAYEFKYNFNPVGTYYNSKFHNSFTRSFGRLERTFHAKSQLANIGPGSYQIPTYFGARCA